METKITRQMLKEMQPHEIFKSGFHFGARWVAVRGGVDDWAIYWMPNRDICMETDEQIAKMGDKILDERDIVRLVPCDNEAFKRYRY